MRAGVIEAIEAARRAQAYDRLIAAVPYASYLGVQAETVDGALLARLPFRADLVGNPARPALHGGVVAGLLEVASVLELLRVMEGAAIPRTITMTVDYLRSAGAADTHARGVVTRLGRRVANLRVEAWQDDPARPVAQGHAHFLVTPPRAVL